MQRIILLFIILINSGNFLFTKAQQYSLGWEGDYIIQQDKFLNAGNWIPNQSDLSKGDSAYVTVNSHLNLHWKFGKGERHKWVQCYNILSEPLDLTDIDFIGIDVRGSDCNYEVNRHVELKFEDGTNYASYIWDNLAQIYRWCERLTLAKKQFTNSNIFNWNNVTVISLAIVMNPDDKADTLEDSGTVSFRNLISCDAGLFERVDYLEPLDSIESIRLDTIKTNAVTAIMERQAATGLLYTWKQDNSSWLYGHGLALKILTKEGTWENTVPINNFADAAAKLAHFLADNQEEMGFWPRAWNANTGEYIVYVENDNTVWMGDFPWILGGLASYYKKSGDSYVVAAINNAKSFLYNLIDNNGKVNTINIYTLNKTEVNNYEGYAATIYCLYEIGDTSTAGKVMDYLLDTGWDSELKYWKEGPGSRRPVLLVNTWLSSIYAKAGYTDMAVKALSLAGKLLYTRGPGEPPGLDGVGPVATWYEGTLSYISAGGPRSNSLFNGIADYINSDGTVPAYNDNLGAMAGIWAVDWSSLDATSWLYYAAARKSPFDTTETIYRLETSIPETRSASITEDIQIYSFRDKIYIISDPAGNTGEIKIELYSSQGILTGTGIVNPGNCIIDINKLSFNKILNRGFYIIKLYHRNRIITHKLIYNNP
jgi:hypothetical protein